MRVYDCDCLDGLVLCHRRPAWQRRICYRVVRLVEWVVWRLPGQPDWRYALDDWLNDWASAVVIVADAYESFDAAR